MQQTGNSDRMPKQNHTHSYCSLSRYWITRVLLKVLGSLKFDIELLFRTAEVVGGQFKQGVDQAKKNISFSDRTTKHPCIKILVAQTISSTSPITTDAPTEVTQETDLHRGRSSKIINLIIAINFRRKRRLGHRFNFNHQKQQKRGTFTAQKFYQK